MRMSTGTSLSSRPTLCVARFGPGRGGRLAEEETKNLYFYIGVPDRNGLPPMQEALSEVRGVVPRRPGPEDPEPGDATTLTS